MVSELSPLGRMGPIASLTSDESSDAWWLLPGFWTRIK